MKLNENEFDLTCELTKLMILVAVYTVCTSILNVYDLRVLYNLKCVRVGIVS